MSMNYRKWSIIFNEHLWNHLNYLLPRNTSHEIVCFYFSWLIHSMKCKPLNAQSKIPDRLLLKRRSSGLWGRQHSPPTPPTAVALIAEVNITSNHPFSPGSAIPNMSDFCELPLDSDQKSVQPRLVWWLGKKSPKQPAGFSHRREKCPKKQIKQNWEGFNFAQTPYLSHIYLPSRKAAFCVLERSTPFQLKCHSQRSCCRGKRRPTCVPISEPLLQVPAPGSARPEAP